MAFAIDMGYIKTQSQLINSLRTMWEQKWSKKIFK
jgi:hypothetical protein